jgi:hypothetical protein
VRWRLALDWRISAGLLAAFVGGSAACGSSEVEGGGGTASLSAAPSGVTATPLSSTLIRVSWIGGGGVATGYKIERSVSASSGFAQVTTVNAAFTSCDDSGLTPSTTYFYRVRATNAAGDSAYSNVASATTQAPPGGVPVAPSGLTAEATSSSAILLRWSDNDSTQTEVSVERSTSPTSGFARVTILPAQSNSYGDIGLAASTTYYYRVWATNAAGHSAYSNVASATTQAPAAQVPTAPSSAAAAATSSTGIHVSWQDNSSDETGFKIERSTSAGTGFVQVTAVAANLTTYDDPGLTPSTTYYYRVRAANAAGDSAYSNVASATTQAPATGVPAAPSNVTAVATSANTIHLSWNDNSADEGGFSIERSLSASSGFAQIGTGAADATSYDDAGALSASTTYYYRVRAYNGSGYSVYSNMANATTASGSGTVRVVNSSPYTVVSVKIDGSEQLPPGFILPVNNAITVQASPGAHTYRIQSQMPYAPNRGYIYEDPFTVPADSQATITYVTPTIVDMLTNFRPSRNWQNYFLNCLNGYNPEWAVITFYPDGTWASSANTVEPRSGTVTLVSWPANTTNISFRLCPSCAATSLMLTSGGDTFWYANVSNCSGGVDQVNYTAQ